MSWTCWLRWPGGSPGILAGLLLILAPGCGPIWLAPVSARPRAQPFVPAPGLEAELIGTATLQGLSERFGAPVLANQPERWAVFRVCASFTNTWYWGWVFPLPVPPLPFPERSSTQCQTVGCWFGVDGKVVRCEVWWDDFHQGYFPGRNDPEDLDRLAVKMTRHLP